MARGKLKYRDVVGGKNRNKKQLPKKKAKQRKTYSLYKDNSRKVKKPPINKRLEHNLKRSTPREVQSEQDSSDSDDVVDHLKELRASFAPRTNSKHSHVIDSNEDSSEEEEVSEQNRGGGQNEDVEILGDDDLSDELIDSDDKVIDSSNGDDVELEIPQNDGEENINDPFVKHVRYEFPESLLTSLQNSPVIVTECTQSWPALGKLLIHIPKCQEVQIVKQNSYSIEEEKKTAPVGKIPVRIDNFSLFNPEMLFIKSQIGGNLLQANKSSNDGTLFTPLQSELFSIINDYQDICYCQRSFSNAEEIRFVYSLHVVNHILKTRLKVIHHNVRLSKKEDVPEDFRDQGLVRPKVLMIVPFKDSAYRIIQMIISILLPDDKGHVMNKNRFLDEYGSGEMFISKSNPKPDDYQLTFSGNTNDDFKMGITVTKKSLKLYADFYSSDIIIASPLGLRTTIGAEGESERDYDFLASIELLIVDQAELFLMQNWDHLIHIFNHLHLQPKDSHGTDFSRVRTWSLNGWAKYYRQTLIFSSMFLPEINSIFNKRCQNFAGKIKISNPVEFGSIRQVVVQIPHVFQKFQTTDAQQSIDSRFDFFVDKIFPQQRDSIMKQTLIYVANYFDFVRLRNYFKREDISFVQISDYTKEGKVARARDMFFHGSAHFLLYTERFHFFNRIRVKGIRHIVFYQPPNFSNFYYEMCNLMQETNMNKKIGSVSNMTVTVLYSKYDVYQLSELVGTERAVKMLQSERNVHMMVTGGD